MDFSALLNTMLSGESVAGMESLTGASGSEVTSVLNSVLPSLLSGAQGQAENEATAAGFAGTISVTNAAGDDLGTLTVGETTKINGSDYTLSLNGGTLALSLNVPNETPDPDIPDGASVVSGRKNSVFLQK